MECPLLFKSIRIKDIIHVITPPPPDLVYHKLFLAVKSQECLGEVL